MVERYNYTRTNAAAFNSFVGVAAMLTSVRIVGGNIQTLLTDQTIAAPAALKLCDQERPCVSSINAASPKFAA